MNDPQQPGQLSAIAPRIIQAADGKFYEIYPLPPTGLEPQPYTNPTIPPVNPNRYTITHVIFGVFLLIGGLLSVALVLNSVRPPAPVILPQPVNKPSCIAFC